MQRTTPVADLDTDRLVFVATEPVAEADLYDYPGAYAQRFGALEAVAPEAEPETAFAAEDYGTGEYVNHFECIPMG